MPTGTPSLAHPGKFQTAELARTWCSPYQTNSERWHLLSKSCLCWPASARLSSSGDGERRETGTIYSKRMGKAGRKEDRIHSCTKFLKSEYLYIVSFLFKKRERKHWRQNDSNTNEHFRDWWTLNQGDCVFRICSVGAPSTAPWKGHFQDPGTLGHLVEGAGRGEHL